MFGDNVCHKHTFAHTSTLLSVARNYAAQPISSTTDSTSNILNENIIKSINLSNNRNFKQTHNNIPITVIMSNIKFLIYKHHSNNLQSLYHILFV